MSIALPTQLVDAVSSAASTGMEAAGNFLHDAAHAAESAADATSGKARRLLRASRRNLPTRSHRNGGRRVLTLAAISVAILAALAVLRAKSSCRHPTGTTDDDVKGPVKEATGALLDNDGLERAKVKLDRH